MEILNMKNLSQNNLNFSGNTIGSNAVLPFKVCLGFTIAESENKITFDGFTLSNNSILDKQL